MIPIHRLFFRKPCLNKSASLNPSEVEGKTDGAVLLQLGNLHIGCRLQACRFFFPPSELPVPCLRFPGSLLEVQVAVL